MDSASSNLTHEQILAAAEEQYQQAIDLVAEGDPCAAAEGFEACLKLDPEKLDAMHGLIRALQDCGRLDEGIVWAKQLIEHDPSDPLAHTSLSILYQHKGMIKEAEAEATKARLLDWKRQLQQGTKPTTQL
ncbi:MAG TPA: tetratricopeptide repeat protein [Acidisarcina sp.]|nr:tetratricopeptide repeat protein [Acidisarcina sp.]